MLHCKQHNQQGTVDECARTHAKQLTAGIRTSLQHSHFWLGFVKVKDVRSANPPMQEVILPDEDDSQSPAQVKLNKDNDSQIKLEYFSLTQLFWLGFVKVNNFHFASAVSLLKSGEQCYIKAVNNNSNNNTHSANPSTQEVILTTDDSKTAAMVKLNKDNGFTNSTDSAVHGIGSAFTKPGHAYSKSFLRVACYVPLQASNSYLKGEKKKLQKKQKLQCYFKNRSLSIACMYPERDIIYFISIIFSS